MSKGRELHLGLHPTSARTWRTPKPPLAARFRRRELSRLQSCWPCRQGRWERGLIPRCSAAHLHRRPLHPTRGFGRHSLRQSSLPRHARSASAPCCACASATAVRQDEGGPQPSSAKLQRCSPWNSSIKRLLQRHFTSIWMLPRTARLPKLVLGRRWARWFFRCAPPSGLECTLAVQIGLAISVVCFQVTVPARCCVLSLFPPTHRRHRVGGAAGTIAKSISAYDMSVSDSMYGACARWGSA